MKRLRFTLTVSEPGQELHPRALGVALQYLSHVVDMEKDGLTPLEFVTTGLGERHVFELEWQTLEDKE